MNTDFSRLQTQALAKALSKGEPDILANARERYPFINQYNPQVKFSPNHPNPEGFYSEIYQPMEDGYGEYRRPAEFPSKSLGVEIYKPGNKFGSDDLAGEVLHYDNKANQTRADLIKTFTPHQIKVLRREPDYETSVKEKLPPRRAMENVTDALMRGYTVGQWPKKAIQNFGLNLNQTLMLDSLKNYMETGNK